MTTLLQGLAVAKDQVRPVLREIAPGCCLRTWAQTHRRWRWLRRSIWANHGGAFRRRDVRIPSGPHKSFGRRQHAQAAKVPTQPKQKLEPTLRRNGCGGRNPRRRPAAGLQFWPVRRAPFPRDRPRAWPGWGRRRQRMLVVHTRCLGKPPPGWCRHSTLHHQSKPSGRAGFEWGLSTSPSWRRWRLERRLECRCAARRRRSHRPTLGPAGAPATELKFGRSHL